jgi:hypothetical protein
MTRKAAIPLVTMVEKVRWLLKEKGAEVFNSAVAKLRQVKSKWILVLIILTFVLSGFGIIAGSRVNVAILGSGGNIKVDGVGVYSDSGCSVALAYLDWGTLEPGSSVKKTVYIRNEGNAAAMLSMTTSNWNPTSASTYLGLSWNYNGQTVDVNAVTQVTLTLSASSSISGITSFSFDITIVESA